MSPPPKENVPHLDVPHEHEVSSSPLVGWAAGLDAKGHLLVDFDGNSAGPLRARHTVPLDECALREAVASRQAVVLLFDRGRPSRPIVIGLIQTPSPTPLVDALLSQSLADVPRQARVDGRQVTIEAREEVVLRCGKASITLRRDGQVLLRGVNIRTEAEELQRIKGGKVRIN